tara:strand:- start:18 stop:254 length:237 start_codon:yes stop_codon:yes gene_type:complete
MKPEDIETLKNIIENTKITTELKSVFKIERKKNPRNLVLSNQMLNEYGLEMTGLVAAFIELFYQKGKEDALKELKDKL